MKKEIKAVIFDQDGLMFDTERVSANAWTKVQGEFGVTVGEDLLSRCRGTNKEECKIIFLEAFGQDFDFDGLREKKMECFHEDIRMNGLPIKEGLLELLSYLKSNSFKISLATASAKEWSMKNLKEAGADQYFDEFVCGDMVSHCKPDPEIFLTAAAKLGIDPEYCLVLEDSLNGVEAAIRGGFPVIMVPDMTQPTEELIQRITAKCNSLLDVKQMFEDKLFIRG